MVDLSQFSNVAVLAVLIGTVIQLFKAKLKPESTPYAAVLLGIILALGMAFVQGQIKGAQDVVSWALSGFFAGLTAIGGYEVSLRQLKVKKES